MKSCPHCNIVFDLTSKSPRWFSSHVNWCEQNPKREEKLRKLAETRAKISAASRDKMKASIKRAHALGKYEEANENKRGKSGTKHLEETKIKLSIARKRFLQNNPDKHPWKNSNKFISGPCEKLKCILRKNDIVFVEEWKALEDRNFSIDIAFPDIKLGIEVNGNQHYNRDGTLSEYYQKRHDLICKAGWTLIELHYQDCFNEEKILSIIDQKEQPDYTEYFKVLEEKRKSKIPSLKAGQKVKQKADEKWEPYKKKVLDSNIDFSKYGWVKELSKILPVKEGKIGWWMKRYLSEFYETKCFKRK